MEIGAADNPNDILIALYHGGLSSGAVLQSLMNLGLTGHRDLPGTIHQPLLGDGRTARQSQPPGCQARSSAKLLTASAKTSVWRSTSAAVVVGAISAML